MKKRMSSSSSFETEGLLRRTEVVCVKDKIITTAIIFLKANLVWNETIFN